MTIRFKVYKLLGIAAIAGSTGTALPAGAQPSFGDCAKSLERSGYVIYDMEFTGSTYDIDARKGGQKWDVKANRNCRILDARPD
jgi:hypothetical protein